ncbi:hypothetical protein CW362_09365 [Streptomyces populi]|uniref:Uncharacterized protein n=1 Tax=Streptomyces populi TaxID=2058924 RepID=A0A2I0STS6_9ACTN|nr:hypothetical protein CW362_09365 [Streptomyces populi]
MLASAGQHRASRPRPLMRRQPVSAPRRPDRARTGGRPCPRERPPPGSRAPCSVRSPVASGA